MFKLYFSYLLNRRLRGCLHDGRWDDFRASEGGGAKYPGPGVLRKARKSQLDVRIVYHRFMFVLHVNEIRLLAHYPLIVIIDRKMYQM